MLNDSEKIRYREILPDQCPPIEASGINKGTVIRLVKNNPPMPSDFLSYKALGKSIRGVDECRLASCSTFLCDEMDYKIAGLTKLPLLRNYKYVCYLNVDLDSGVAKINHKTRHVDYWFYRTYDPSSKIEKIEEIS